MNQINKEDTESMSQDIVKSNIEQLRNLFPEVFSEGRIDFETLQSLLADYIEKNDERYSFTWKGKANARRIAQTTSTATLRPVKEESRNWDKTENLYIEGDNLEVLKLLQKSYHNKIKMIYIDPPYNTGHDFVYADDFKDSLKNYFVLTGQINEDGKRVSTNSDTNGRYHSNWLNMIYPRLKLARNLLKNDGVIFISIDEIEVNNLKKICDEIFGEENVEITIWNKEADGSSGTLKQISTIRNVHEYILCAYKTRNQVQFSKINEPLVGKEDEFQTANLAVNLERENIHHKNYFTLVGPNGDSFSKQWKWDKEKIEELIKQDLIYWGSDGRKQPRLIIPTDHRRTTYLTSILNYGGTTVGRKDFEELMGEDCSFSYPKPVLLLSKLVETSTDRHDIVLDFFSGSSTTAQSVMKVNANLGEERKFIMIQLPEPIIGTGERYKNICEIGKERIRRAGDKILKELKKKQSTQKLMSDEILAKPDDLDIGFKVFRLDSSNINTWDSTTENLEQTLLDSVSNIKTERSQEDVLYEVLLKYGLNLTLAIEEYEQNGKKIYSVGFGSLVICLDDEIDISIAEKIVEIKDKKKPETMNVIFKDNGFKDDVVKTNTIQLLKKHGVESVRSI